MDPTAPDLPGHTVVLRSSNTFRISTPVIFLIGDFTGHDWHPGPFATRPPLTRGNHPRTLRPQAQVFKILIREDDHRLQQPWFSKFSAENSSARRQYNDLWCIRAGRLPQAL
jgi:hypothetical protein